VAPIIAEVKRIIPKLADEEARPKDERSAAILAGMYQEGGAIGISLVTEAKHFGGQPEEDVPAVLQNTSIPLLIKDFILDEEKVDFYAKLVYKSGKDCLSRVALLLTAHWLGNRLPVMLRYIHSQSMLALVETRTPEDLQYLGHLKETTRLVGINNKNIDELEKGEDRLRLTLELVNRYRAVVGDCLLISESAHRRPEDVRRSIVAGADAILVGTPFMLSKQPARTVASFAHALESEE
jgi:indole-3-glycerol phosphate synthase